MKVLKKIGIILGILLALFLILGIFMSKDIHVSKSVNIEAPSNFAFNIANDLSNEELWNPWAKADTSMILALGDKTFGEGASYTWTSDESGEGLVTVTKVVSDLLIEADISFDGSDPHQFSYQFDQDGDETEMTYSMDMKLSYPVNVFAPITKFIMKRYFKKGMESLGEIAKRRYEVDEYFGHTVKEESLNERHFVMNRDVVQMQNIQKFYAQNLGSMFQKVQEEGLSMHGMPCGIFFKYNIVKGETDMAAAIPVLESRDIKGLSSLTLPAKPGLIVDYYGDYDDITSAHNAIEAYMKDHNIFSDPPIIEEYVTDPIEEKDPSKWLTKVTYYY